MRALSLFSSIGRRPWRSYCSRWPATDESLRRSVATLSPLGAAFNTTKPVKGSQPRGNQGLFQIPQLYDHTGFHVLLEQARCQTADLVTEATSPSRQRKLVAVFDELSDSLCRVADMSDFVRVAHPDPQYASAAEHVCTSISSLVEKLNTNTDIYTALKRVLQEGDSLEMDDVDRRVGALFLFDFEQSGIHLPTTERQYFVELSEQILALGSAFMQGVHRPVYVPRTALPERLQDVFSSSGEHIMVTGLFADNPSDIVREAAYRIYLHTNRQQQEILELLLEARSQLATLAGFRTFAHRSLSGTMAGSPEQVVKFLELLAESVRSSTSNDVAIISKIKQRSGGSATVYPWDTTYYGGIARHELCSVRGMELAPYFSLGACIEGLSNLFTDLFGISLQRVDTDPGEVWSSDVHKLVVTHEEEGELGVIYCDLFERSGKPHHDCHFTVRGGRCLADGSYQQPTVVLMLNLPQSRGPIPSLLSLGAVENLFHEFGHAMHSMLGRTRYQHVTGTRCPTDFAEVPSVLMEYFASDIRVLSRFARHWQTGESVPLDALERLIRSRRMFAASEMQQQVYYSLVDQAYHGEYPKAGQTTESIAADLQRQYLSLPPATDTAWQLRFGHFVGYGSRYYSYLMSRAVAARIWHQCFRDDPFSRAAGVRYRNLLLARGGERDPGCLVEGVLGERPTTSMLANALLDELRDK